MKELIKPNLKSIRIFFFLIGIIATLAYRIIIVLDLNDPYWVKVAWYIGTIGFILYFGHRFEIQRRRAKFVKEAKTAKKVALRCEGAFFAIQANKGIIDT